MGKPSDNFEFLLLNLYSWKSFSLSIGMSICLILTLMLDGKYKSFMLVCLVLLTLIFLVLRIKEIIKEKKLIITAHSIIYDAKSVQPIDIEEMIFYSSMVDIRQKNNAVKRIRLVLEVTSDIYS